MRNLFIDTGTQTEIDRIVDRLHRDLKPVNNRIVLPQVRELLKLDLGYYTANDPSLLDEVVHKLRLGAHQVLRIPMRLREVVDKFGLSALLLPARKRILLDQDMPDLKKRWAESHEITHSLLPWHQEFMLGDTQSTLSPACHDQIEAEANYGAGRLLYPNEALIGIARSGTASIAHVKTIAQHFGNTITSALWRFVELSDAPCLGIIGAHPQRAGDDEVIAYFIRSRSFSRQFAHVTESEILTTLRSFCSYKKAGPLGSHEFVLVDLNGDGHTFVAESFSNTHQVLTLILCRGKRTTAIAI